MSRILVVDDAPLCLMMISRLVTGQGHEVATAKNGKEALEVLQTAPFDLLISDVNMEPINGIELLHIVKKSYPKMGVIMVTAYGAMYSAEEAEKSGAFAYLPKPFKNSVLFETVRRALEPRGDTK